MNYFIKINEETIETDKAGYLLNVADWTVELAQIIADNEQIEMTDEHWEVVNFVREFYLEFNTSPAIRALVKAMQIKYGADKISSRYLQRLFPDGPAKQATKIAGLPKPAKCL
jgi:tRNA 2-thiouridine synthesizing protein E